MGFWPFRNAKSRALLIEDRGASRIYQLAEVAGSKSTSQKVMELAWTAGPVTLIASVGGYYFGNGKMLPTNTLIFFIAYTVIAGVIGLAAHFIFRLTRDKKLHEAQEQLTAVVGNLPDRILQLRDLQLQQLDEDARRLESARLLLQEVDLGPEWLGVAVRTLGAEESLVRLAEEVEVLRRAGLYTRIADLVAQQQHRIDGLVARFADDVPQLAELLRARFHGERPSLQQGVPRTRYFIERIFAAIDDDDASLMTQTDVQEVFTLLFELMSGRRIPMLVFDYSGDWQLAESTNDLEKERLRFRLARSRSYSRLLALATFLNDFGDSASLAPVGLTGQQLLEYCREQIESLLAEYQAEARRSPLRRTLKQALEKALELYHQAYLANRQTGKEFERFQRHVEAWRRAIAARPKDERQIDAGEGGSGLQIIEDSIYLNDKQKMKLVSALYKPFLKQARNYERMNDPARQLRVMKHLAIRIALALDEQIELRKPEVQRAIDNANTLNMGYFESDLSVRTKIGWGEAMVKELEKDMCQAAEALAQAIYRFYGLRLGSQALEELHQRYGVDPEQIRAFYAETPTAADVERHLLKPFPIPRAPLDWRLALRD
ncbi:hypothetical protein [Motiliproteus sediminis]|uniref:hypothetical protein n=1 Tax=Motiliproteus sediminis TaxID=1468178 RepID=UPI001AEFEA15|nr:hypothetical protein [Motiliproteus sediminis]